MYFAPSPQQRDLQGSVRELLADRFPLSWVREVYDDPHADADPATLWKQIADQGWLAVLIPEAFGGLGLGLVEAGLVSRCFGAGAIPGPYLATVVAAEAIRLAGSDQQRAQWLGAVSEGRAKLAFAFRSAPGAAWDASGVGLTISGGRLAGVATQVEFADAADAIVVAAREGDEIRMFLVRPSDAAVQLEVVPALDRTTRLSAVRFDGVDAEPLPAGDSSVLGRVVDRAASLYAHDLVGIAREALTRTVRYDTERMQYGRAIGSFQAVKHVLADLHLGLTMAEHATLYASYALDRDEPGRAGLAASVAKAKASDVARDVTAAMIQLHGGIGFTWEHETHIFFKRAKREEYVYGDAEWHRQRIARLLVGPGMLPGGPSSMGYCSTVDDLGRV